MEIGAPRARDARRLDQDDRVLVASSVAGLAKLPRERAHAASCSSSVRACLRRWGRCCACAMVPRTARGNTLRYEVMRFGMRLPCAIGIGLLAAVRLAVATPASPQQQIALIAKPSVVRVWGAYVAT